MSELIRLSKTQSVHLVELSLPDGLDSEEFDRLNETLLREIAAAPDGRWVLDLSAVTYAGSAALGLLVNLRQRLKEGGGVLVLCGLSSRLSEIFHACCLESLFEIDKTREDAMARAGKA